MTRRWVGIALGAILALAGLVVVIGGAWRLHKSRTFQLFGELVTAVATDDSVVALTFDDGPSAPYTDSILELLQESRVHATFFVTGSALERYSAIAKRLIGLTWYLERTDRTTVLWTLEPETWYRSADEMVKHVLDNARPGSIILLHVEVPARVQPLALPRIVENLRAKGYDFVTVSDLMARATS